MATWSNLLRSSRELRPDETRHRPIAEQMRLHAVWIGLIIAAAAYYPRFASSGDVELYPLAAQCLLASLPFQTCAMPFTYPPAFAFVMIPFAPLPPGLRTLLWYVVTVGGSVLVYACCERLARRLFPGPWTARQLAWLRAASLVLSLKFILAVLENQAYDTFALAFVAAGLLGLAHRQEHWGGALLGVAAAIKATPLIFLPYLLMKRRFVAAAWFTGALVALSLLPDLLFTPQGTPHGYIVTWLRDVAGVAVRNDASAAPVPFWAGANPFNHSLRGALARLMDEQANPAEFKIALYATWLGFAAILGILLLKSPRRDAFVAVDGALLLIGTLMLSPMTSRSHYVVLIVPYVILVAAYIRDAATRPLGGPMLAASFILLTATSNDLVGDRVGDWAYHYSLMPLGAMVLIIYLAFIIWRAQQGDRPGRSACRGLVPRPTLQARAAPPAAPSRMSHRRSPRR